MDKRLIKTSKKASLRQGFSLIESLISLSLFLFVVIASLEFFISSRDHFLMLKDEQEKDIAIFAGMDKMRIDILDCGRGLLSAQSLGIIAGVESSGGTLTVRAVGKEMHLLCDLVAGQTRITVQSTSGIAKGQEICICDDIRGEAQEILSVDNQSFMISSPLKFAYSQQETKVLSIEKVSFSLDQKSHILRRRVNSSPAQPLLEEVEDVHFSYEGASNLVEATLKMTEGKEYAITVFPKNLGLVPAQETF